MTSNEDDEKKKLYEFNNDYLDDLNEIRRQLNLVAISKEDTRFEADENFDFNSPPLELDEDLYTCDESYLEHLNHIRTELNLEEIRNTSFSSTRTNVSECSLGDKGSLKNTENFDNVKDFELSYTPPKKKMCLRTENSPIYKESHSSISENKSSNSEHFKNQCCLETEDRIYRVKVKYSKHRVPLSVPEEKEEDHENVEKAETRAGAQEVVNYSSLTNASEQSSPVISDKASVNVNLKCDYGGDAGAFYSLNVPTSNDSNVKIRATVTTLTEEEKPTCSKMSEEKTETQLIKAPVKAEDFQKTWSMSEKGDVEHFQKRYNHNDDKIEIDSDNAETPGRKKKSASGGPKVSFVTFEDYDDDDEEEIVKKTRCRCFSICFKKKRNNYFS